MSIQTRNFATIREQLKIAATAENLLAQHLGQETVNFWILLDESFINRINRINKFDVLLSASRDDEFLVMADVLFQLLSVLKLMEAWSHWRSVGDDNFISAYQNSKESQLFLELMSFIPEQCHLLLEDRKDTIAYWRNSWLHKPVRSNGHQSPNGTNGKNMNRKSSKSKKQPNPQKRRGGKKY